VQVNEMKSKFVKSKDVYYCYKHHTVINLFIIMGKNRNQLLETEEMNKNIII
jgi:hypothetical protein